MSMPQKLDPLVFYVRSLKFIVDKREYTGVAVLPKKASYDIEIRSANDIDLLTIRTCAREFYGEKVGTGGGIIFWQNEQKYTYHYELDPDLEYGRICPMEIAAYNVKTGSHSWGYVDFATDEYTLPATWHCNGMVSQWDGVSVCQNRVGNKVKVKFSSSVIWNPSLAGMRCAILEGLQRGTEFEFFVPEGSCFFNRI